jgi:hypothetical protein
MTVRELMSVLIYFPPDGQDIPVWFENGAKLDSVQVTDTGSKLSVELRGTNSVLNTSRTSQEDKAEAKRAYMANRKARQVGRTISDRAEIARITKTSSSRHGYQIRA